MISSTIPAANPAVTGMKMRTDCINAAQIPEERPVETEIPEETDLPSEDNSGGFRGLFKRKKS